MKIPLSSTAKLKPPSSMVSSSFLAGETSLLPPPAKPPDLNLGGAIPPVPPVPPEPPPQLSALLLSPELALRLLLISCLPPPLASSTSSTLQFLHIAFVTGPVVSTVSFVFPPSRLLQVQFLSLSTPLGLVTAFCSSVVEVCVVLIKEIYGLSKIYDPNCGLFLSYLSDHIHGEAELPRLEDVTTDLPPFEDVYNLPQCEDATDLPQYEVVIKLPSFMVVLADLPWYGKDVVDLALVEAGFKQASTSVVLTSSCISVVEARSWAEAQGLISSHVPSSRPLLHSITPLPNRVFVVTDATWQGSSSHRYVSSALMAEALAIQAAISAAFVLEIPGITVLLDSLPLISLLTSDVLNELKSLLYDIRISVALFSSICFFHFKRTASVVAVSLAKTDLSSVNSTSF